MSEFWTEADTAIFTIYSKIRKNEWKGTVVISAEDTDLYVQAAYVSQKVSGKLLIKKKNIYVNICDEDSSESDDIDHCSETDSTEFENDD